MQETKLWTLMFHFKSHALLSQPSTQSWSQEVVRRNICNFASEREQSLYAWPEKVTCQKNKKKIRLYYVFFYTNDQSCSLSDIMVIKNQFPSW